jgi:hypothetical protein
MKGQLETFRMFLRFVASIDAVQTGLDEKILLPTTTPENARKNSSKPAMQFRHALLGLRSSA